MTYTMFYNIFSPDLQFSLAVLQREAAIFDARTRAAETLKRRRDDHGEDYYSRRSQDASDGRICLGLKTSGATQHPVYYHI